MILDGRKRKRKRKRKRIMLIRNEPHVSLVTKVEVATEVAAVDGETMEEIGLMDHQ